MEDPHASPFGSRSTISSLLNDSSADTQETDPFAYGSPFLSDSAQQGSAPPDREQPPSKKRRQSYDSAAGLAETNGQNHNYHFPSLQLHPLSGSGLQLDHHQTSEEERRVLAEERRSVESERQQLEADKQAFAEEKRLFEEEKRKWLEEKDKQSAGGQTTSTKPTLSFFGRRAQAQLEEQSFGCAFLKGDLDGLLTHPSSDFAAAHVVLQDMMTQKTVELPLAVGIGYKESTLPKKAVQDLGAVMIPQQTRDYGPSSSKTGYLYVSLKDQKGGFATRIEAVEGDDRSVSQNYFIITKSDLALLRCVANEKAGTISNNLAGTSTEETAPAGKSKRKK